MYSANITIITNRNEYQVPLLLSLVRNILRVAFAQASSATEQLLDPASGTLVSLSTQKFSNSFLDKENKRSVYSWKSQLKIALLTLGSSSLQFALNFILRMHSRSSTKARSTVKRIR